MQYLIVHYLSVDSFNERAPIMVTQGYEIIHVWPHELNLCVTRFNVLWAREEAHEWPNDDVMQPLWPKPAA